MSKDWWKKRQAKEFLKEQRLQFTKNELDKNINKRNPKDSDIDIISHKSVKQKAE